MPRKSASPPHPRPNTSSGRTANPRRSARLHKATSSCPDQAPVDQSSQENTIESHSIDTSSTPGARQNPEQEKADQAVKRSLSPRVEKHTVPERQRSRDAGQVVQRSSSRRTRTDDAGHSVERSSSPPIEQASVKKRKRSKDAESPPSAPHLPLETRQSPVSDAPHPSSPDLDHEEQPTDPVDYWRKHLVWPSNFFESEGPAKMSSASRSLSTRQVDRRQCSKEVWNLDIPNPGLESPETRAFLLKDDDVKFLFDDNSREPVEGLPEKAEKVCETLKKHEQTVPSCYHEEIFTLIGTKTMGKNEEKVVQDVGPFVAPHVDQLQYLGNSLPFLAETVDEMWSHCIPILASNRPRPDYTAGFHATRFSVAQTRVLRRLGPGTECSFYKATEKVLFPFFTCEAKGGSKNSGTIVEAEQQSLETALIASRGLIELFRRANLEDEIQDRILCFSAAYTDVQVRVYAHLAEDVRAEFPTFHRHKMADLQFPSCKWDSYKLIKNIYEHWVPTQYALICKAIDALAKIPGSYVSSSSSTALSSVTGGTRRSEGGSVAQRPSKLTDRSSRSRSQKDSAPDTSMNPRTKK